MFHYCFLLVRVGNRTTVTFDTIVIPLRVIFILFALLLLVDGGLMVMYVYAFCCVCGFG